MDDISVHQLLANFHDIQFLWTLVDYCAVTILQCIQIKALSNLSTENSSVLGAIYIVNNCCSLTTYNCLTISTTFSFVQCLFFAFQFVVNNFPKSCPCWWNAWVCKKNYKKSNSYNYKQQRAITFNNALLQVIWNNLDTNQENMLGYFKGDDNGAFKSASDADADALTSDSVSIS